MRIMSDRKVAVVTGGSAGGGRGIGGEFAAPGYDVAGPARGQGGLDGAVADVEQCGGRGLGIVTDVAALSEVEGAGERGERDVGQIDVWVNVAFVGALRFFWDPDDETYRRITDVTYMGQ